MPRAIPGGTYVVLPGDTLVSIAKQAYGRGNKWRDIYRVNQTKLRSGDPNIIYPGEVLTIPLDDVAVAAALDLLSAKLPQLPGKEKDDFTILIEGVQFKVQAGRVIRSIDTAADGWSATILWNPKNPLTNRVLLPFKYPVASCYLGSLLTVNGYLYNMKNRVTPSGIFKDLEGFSFTADIVDSTIKPPYEQQNVTLQTRAQTLVLPLGILIKWEVLEPDLPFDRVTAKPEDTIFKHLSELAAQRGILISSTPLGELLFTKAALGAPIGTIQEEFPPGKDVEISFNGRKRFNTYKAISQTPGRKKAAKGFTKSAISLDVAVPRSRFKTFIADNSTAADIQKAANWKRSKQVADSLTIPFPVSSWYDPTGNLWRENTLVVVRSDSLQVPFGFTFLIRSVEYIYEPGGTTAVLSLVPPQVYTGLPIVEPWANPIPDVVDEIQAALELVDKIKALLA